MEKLERLNVKTGDEVLKAIFIIIKERGRGSVTGAIGTSFSWLLDPKTLEEKGASFSSHFLSPKIRERILSGESLIDIANEISETKKAPENLNKTFKPKAEISPLNEDEEKIGGDKKEKKQKEKDDGNKEKKEKVKKEDRFVDFDSEEVRGHFTQD